MSITENYTGSTQSNACLRMFCMFYDWGWHNSRQMPLQGGRFFCDKRSTKMLRLCKIYRFKYLQN